MCLDSSDKSHVIRGTLFVRPRDHFFWFDRPKFLFCIMQLILFQNSFQLSFFTWSLYKFGLRFCFHRKTQDIVIKFGMGVLIPILCSYVTLRLYALVIQMGTSMGSSIFHEEVLGGLKRWRTKATRNLATRNKNLGLRSIDASVASSPFDILTATNLSIETGYASDDNIVERSRKGIVAVERRFDQQHQNLGSFEGFDLGRV